MVTRKDADHWSLEKCKSKPWWNITSHHPEWLSVERPQITSVGEDVEKELSLLSQPWGGGTSVLGGRDRALWLSYPAGLAAGWSNSKPEISCLSSFLPTLLRYLPFPSGQHLTCITTLSQLNISQEKWRTYLKQMRCIHWAPKLLICSKVDYSICS